MPPGSRPVCRRVEVRGARHAIVLPVAANVRGAPREFHRAGLLWIAGLTAGAILAVLTGYPLLAISIVCLVVAALAAGPEPAGGTLSRIVDALPPAVAGVVAWIIVVCHAAGVFGLDLLGSRPASAAVLLAPAVVAVAVAARRTSPAVDRDADPVPHTATKPLAPTVPEPANGWTTGLTALPTLVWIIAGLIGARLNNGAGMAWFGRGIDNIQHALQVQFRGLDGGLTYTQFPNPGGAHALIATILATATPYSRTTTPEQSRVALFDLLSTTTMAFWLLFGLLVLSVTILARRAAYQIRPDLGRGPAALVGATAGFALLLAPFPKVLGYGFLTLVLASVGLTAALTAATAPHRGAAAPAVTALAAAASVLITLHTWPLATFTSLPVGYAAAVVLVRRWRTLTVGARLAVVGGALAITASGAGVVWAVLTSVDAMARTATGGVVPPVDVIALAWLALAAPVALVLVKSRRLLLITGTFVVTAGGALGLSLVGRVPLTSYYPSKVLWIAGLVGVPLACAGLLWLLGRLARWRIPRLHTGVLGVAAAVAFGFGTSATTHLAWAASPRWERTVAAVTSTQAPGATIAWDLPDPGGGVVFTDRILDFYRVNLAVLRVFPHERSYTRDCADLTATPHPTVLTEHSQATISAYFTCAPGVVALIVPR